MTAWQRFAVSPSSAAKDVHSPGYYVHIDPDQVFLGAGMWRPDSDSLRMIRERIVAHPAEWSRTLGDKRFKRHFELGDFFGGAGIYTIEDSRTKRFSIRVSSAPTSMPVA